MEYLEEDFRIRSASEFRRTLQYIKVALRDGTLQQFIPKNYQWTDQLTDIEKVDPEGDWPDNVGAFFVRPSTGTRYKLSVETYHGSGGVWQRLPDSDLCGLE